MVSVYMITYNHEAFIGMAIESVMMQKTNFPFELVIGEDNSTDNTRAICNYYLKKYPDKIKLITSENNVGAQANFLRTMRACSHKYIAMCEGDDYWVDVNKLQKQVEFLETNSDYTMVCHESLMFYQNMEKPPRYFSMFNTPKYISFEDICKKWSIATATIVFRQEIVNEICNFHEKYNVHNEDLLVQMFCAHYGKVWFLNEIMAAYRMTLSGSSMSALYKEKAGLLLEKKHTLFNNFNDYTNKKYAQLFEKVIKANLKNNSEEVQKLKMGKFMYYCFHPSKLVNKIINIR